VPTADEYFETACHWASVDRTGGAFEGSPELTRRSIGSGLPQPCGEDEPCCPGPPDSRRQFKGGQQRRHDGWCHDRPGRGLRNPSRDPAGRDPRRTPLMPAVLGLPDGRGSRREQADQADLYREVHMVWSESSTEAGDGSPRCPKDHPETSDSRPRQCIPPGGKGLTPDASTRASLR
jgi:hypothetical protein